MPIRMLAAIVYRNVRSLPVSETGGLYMSTTTSLEQIAQTFTGQLLQQADSGYDQARRVYNGLIDKRPALIARCQGAADVAVTTSPAAPLSTAA
jgi:hypothetical protein